MKAQRRQLRKTPLMAFKVNRRGAPRPIFSMRLIPYSLSYVVVSVAVMEEIHGTRTSFVQ